jgi:hypothetical protein
MKKKKNCFRNLARELESSAADAILAKDAKIVELQEQLDTAWGESHAKDDTIAVLRSMISIVPSDANTGITMNTGITIQTDLERNGCAGYNEEGKQLYECEQPCIMVPVINDSGDRCPEGMVMKWYDWQGENQHWNCVRAEPDQCIGKGCN